MITYYLQEGGILLLLYTIIYNFGIDNIRDPLIEEHGFWYYYLLIENSSIKLLNIMLTGSNTDQVSSY